MRYGVGIDFHCVLEGGVCGHFGDRIRYAMLACDMAESSWISGKCEEFELGI